MTTSKSSKERQADFKQRQIDAGRVRRPIYATPDEHERIKKLLVKLRAKPTE